MGEHIGHTGYCRNPKCRGNCKDERGPVALGVMLKAIREAKIKFIGENNTEPYTMYLTTEEMERLSYEMEDYYIKPWKFKPGDRFMGMRITKTDIPGVRIEA